MSITFLKKYRVIEKIGEGTFSEVLKCQNKTTGVFYAGKKLKRVYESINEITDSPEVIAMKKISRHPNILYMIEYHHDPLPGKLTLIFELMEMSLYDLIRNRKGLKITEQRVRLYIYQLLKGLDHLHKHGIFHRDIKPENILVKGVVVKLADLGSVRGIYSRPPYTEYISTRWYRSPECLLTTGYYGPKMDIWALGCVYYELLELKPLFPGTDEIDQIFKIHNVLGSPHPRLITRLRRQSRNFECAFPIKSGCGIASLVSTLSDYGKDLMKLMLTYDPDNRCSAKRLLEHRSFYELRFLPELINKPRRPVPSAPLTSSSFQQINNTNETKKKTKLSTINETKRSIIHRASPNLSSPAKKIPKHESLSSFSSKKLSIFSSKRI
ncbi:hypothetical protein HCN44_008556 [Aphidius gifuensis]|uniref:Protein kinase domain-containing protein n=1 Tax=Aphidius gifuensis TaxID=684658 RepID=A0A835CN50_APHGI|nr:hypothetical protein HCN44_008556 [Aphidius gifuensis]